MLVVAGYLATLLHLLVSLGVNVTGIFATSAVATAVLGLARAAETTPAAETVKLNPFVVSESDAVGYSAASTLAGTRINTALRDVGAAISVVTGQFMADTASTSLRDLLVYTTNTEAGGFEGNFSGVDTGNKFSSAETTLQNPQNSTRVRGLAGADLTRDFFLTNIPMDAYNTERVDISRGANAILRGLGNCEFEDATSQLGVDPGDPRHVADVVRPVLRLPGSRRVLPSVGLMREDGVAAVMFGISRLVVRHDVNAFRLIFLWGRTKAANRNRAFWGGSSYTPLPLKGIKRKGFGRNG